MGSSYSTLEYVKTGYSVISTGASYIYKWSKPSGTLAAPTDYEDRPDHVELQENTFNTITKLKDSIDVIGRKQDLIESKIQNMISEAIAKNTAGNKKGALFALKRKKLYEKELDNLDQIRSNLELKVMNLETLIINLEVYSTLRLAATQMKTINNEIDVDSLDNTLDDIQEGISITDEISSVLTQPIVADTIDEDDLLQELDELMSDHQERQVSQPVQPEKITEYDFPIPPFDEPDNFSIPCNPHENDIRLAMSM